MEKILPTLKIAEKTVLWSELGRCTWFIEELNRLTGKVYRLPTEAEGEYAARSGGKEEKYAGISDESRGRICLVQ